MRMTAESRERDWLDSKTESEVASRGTQKFRKVGRRLMRRRHPGSAENGAPVVSRRLSSGFETKNLCV